MTDEVSQSAQESPQSPAVAPIVSPEAVQEIAEVITEGMQEAITAPEPVTSEPTPPEAPSGPENSEIEIQASSAPPSPQAATVVSPTQKPSVGAHMREVVRSRKQARLEKVMEMAQDKKVIVNDDVEKLLKVSDATATRYLNTLVLAARLRRTGHDGGARYEPV